MSHIYLVCKISTGAWRILNDFFFFYSHPNTCEQCACYTFLTKRNFFCGALRMFQEILLFARNIIFWQRIHQLPTMWRYGHSIRFFNIRGIWPFAVIAKANATKFICFLTVNSPPKCPHSKLGQILFCIIRTSFVRQIEINS